MRILLIYFCLLAVVNLGFSAENHLDDSFPIPTESVGDPRLLCNAYTGSKIARFDHCIPSNEVVVGIKSLDPVMVYCSPLMINCSRPQQKEEKP